MLVENQKNRKVTVLVHLTVYQNGHTLLDKIYPHDTPIQIRNLTPTQRSCVVYLLSQIKVASLHTSSYFVVVKNNLVF